MSTAIHINSPLLFLHNRQWVLLDTDGVIQVYDGVNAQRIVKNSSEPIIVCYTPFVCSRLKVHTINALDILELWAFVKPAIPVIPTIQGVLDTLHISPSDDTADSMAVALLNAIHSLLQHIKTESGRPSTENMLASLAKTGWGWAKPLMYVLNLDIKDFIPKPLNESLDIWNRLPKWENTAPPPQADTKPITPEEIQTRLRTFLGTGAEHRPQQIRLSRDLCPAFQAKTDDNPNIVIAEGGTGVGKTYAYLAPATVWAEKNEAPVWISTYTKNLQHQIYDQIKSLYPDTKHRNQRVVLCKGRENYLCVSRFKILSQQVGRDARLLKSMVLIARWAEHSMDGDINGKDFPSWLSAVVDYDGNILNKLTLKYDVGETHSGCGYDTCFVDLPTKRARHADIVITNHAFVLYRAVRQYQNSETDMMPHIVFDEGHHLFDACDSAFSVAFGAWEAFRLRRFIITKENLDMFGAGGSLSALMDDVYKGDDSIIESRIKLQQSAAFLPEDNWQTRFKEQRPSGEMEQLLYYIYDFVTHNTKDTIQNQGYNLEMRTQNLPDYICKTAQSVFEQLRDLLPPAEYILQCAKHTFDTESESLYAHERLALQNLISALNWRVIEPVHAWCDILLSISQNTPPDGRLDSLFVHRWTDNNHIQRLSNIGCIRYHIDPMQDFHKIVLQPNRGAVITSATLHDTSPDWVNIRTGIQHLQSPPIQTIQPSPFDYKNNSKVICVQGIQRDNIQQLAGAFIGLFKASGGGALGLFTNIRRSQQVGKIVHAHLARQGMQVYAQHLSTMNIATLIDIFKHDIDSCLLGTDAVRDGVDIIGDSLRLLVLERLPWAVSDILNTTRNTHFTTIKYKEALVRMKLQQAFGRLLRTQNDRGIFVCLQPIPSIFVSAFPQQTEIIRCSLADACQIIADFQRL